ncbi:uncharacterized protein LOC134272342 isoform X2 [Saccostrea cucullata]|uniref:uncharacterized protein LOC134272342 isoform X2 n=1 Tax=Saccostrea cuccullata TaxID=36930 RepID=UPI002ED0A3DD
MRLSCCSFCQNSLTSATSCPSKSVVKCFVETETIAKDTDVDVLFSNLQNRLEQTQCRLKTQSNGSRIMDCFTLNVLSMSTAASPPNCIESSTPQIQNENREEKKSTEMYRISIALAGFGGIVFGAAAAIFTMSAVAKRKQIRKRRKGATFINATYEHNDIVIPSKASGELNTELSPSDLGKDTEPTNRHGSHLPAVQQ